MPDSKKQNYLQGAAILAATVMITKIIGAIYKIPLYNLLGDEGTAHFQITYAIYNLLLTISTAGVPVALSRLISSSAATGRTLQVKRYFSIAMPSFIIIGVVCMSAMLVFAQDLANLMGDPEITAGIRCLAPAVLFCCIISVYRGYSQGHGDMVPTAISQIMEVFCKMLFGLVIAWALLMRGFDTPTISAGAIVGVTVGLGLAVPILMFYKRRAVRRNAYGAEAGTDTPYSRSETFKRIFKTSIPITLGASILNIITLVDTKLVLLRLQSGAGFEYFDAKVLYGVYSKSLTLFNLPAAFIVPVTVSVVPAIAAAIAKRRGREASGIMSSSLKITNLLALPAGLGLCVLSYPIFNVLYWGSNENGPVLLAILGIASYFVCLQLITTSILQANGLERLSMLSLPLGGVIKIIANWFLVGNPNIGILGAPIGTLICYISITLLNIMFIMKKVPDRPNFKIAFVKPFLCTAVMGVAAWAVYGLLSKVGSGFFESGRLPMLIPMCAAIAVAIIVYAVLVVVSGAVTSEDMKLLPKGEKIAAILKIK